MTPAGGAILIVDDDALSRRVMRAALERSGRFSAIVEAADETQVLTLASHPEITFVVLEPRTLDSTLTDLLRSLRKREPPPHVVVFPGDAGSTVALDAIRAGASAVVTKDNGVDALIGAIDRVANGETVVPGTLLTEMIRLLATTSSDGIGIRPIRSPLTTREWEIVHLLALGATTQSIADELVLSTHTVYSHVKGIMRKLDVDTREAAVSAASRIAITVEPGGDERE